MHPDATPAPTTDTMMGALFEQHRVVLLRFLISLTHGNRETAEDLLQETMVRAWRHLDSLPEEPERARRWLLTVARRLVIDSVRQRQLRPAEVGLSDTDDTSSPGDDTSERAMAVQSIHDGLSSLSDMHRHVLTAVYFQGRSVDDVAASLGIPVGTVRSRVHYALRSLRSSMECVHG